MSIDVFFTSAHFVYQISIFQSSFLVLRLLLFICKRTSVLGVCYLFTKDCGPSSPVLYTKAAVLVTRCVYKGAWSLSFAIHLQRTAVLVFHFSFAKDRCPCLLAIHFQWNSVLVWCYLLAKDCGPCPLLFICKRLQSLSSGIHLHAKDCCPCLVLFVCKGLRSLSCAISLQRTAVLVLCH